MKMKPLFLTLLVAVFSVAEAEDSPKPPSEDPWDAVTSRGKIEVEKLAFAEAKKKLTSAINALQFEPKRAGGLKVTVGDLAAEYKTIKMALADFLKTVEPASEAKFFPNLTCEVRVTVPTNDVLDLMDRECKKIITDLQFEPQVNAQEIKKLQSYNFQYIHTYYQDDNHQPLQKILGLGGAKPPEQYIRHSPSPMPPIGPVPVVVPVLPTPMLLPSWAKQTLTVSGSNPLERTALLVAQYEAIQKIHALKLDEKTTLGAILDTQPKARVAVCDFLVASPLKSVKQPEGATVITLTLSLEKLYPLVKDFLPGVPPPQN